MTPREGDTMENGLAARAGQAFAAYRAGDESKMADLVRLLTPILWHTVRAMRLDTATAEDVLQNAWLVLVRNADSITEPRAVLQWLVVTVRREAWRVSKAQSRTRPEDMESGVLAEAPDAVRIEDEVLRDADRSTLWRHIQALPERCRQLLRVIAFAERPDYAALAEALGMPQGSIGPTRGRCLAKLRASLSNDPTWETP